jgi:hypothetical protein
VASSKKQPAAKAVVGQPGDEIRGAIAALRLFDSYIVRELKHHLAVQRLASNDPRAMHGWLALSKKKFRKGSISNLPDLAVRIAMAAGLVLLGDENRKSKRDIIDAADKASDLSTRLADLIKDNATLQFPHADYITGANLRPPASYVTVATARIVRGLSHSKVLQREAPESELKFTAAVEASLDQLQELEFPEFSRMTTGEAYRLLLNVSIGMDMRLLEGRLRAFAKLAKESVACDPITKHPQSKLAREHSFALSLCRLFQYHFATPCPEIATDFTVAVFDIDGLGDDTVKKWWERQADKSL